MASEPETREKVEFLRNPSHYPERPESVEVIETHFAWVFLTVRHVYKMKKPVQQATMDYRTLESRQRGCRNELELNRRLAPLVYIDVVPLALDRGGDMVLGRGQRVVDWLVRMHRLPASRMLDRAIAEDTIGSGDIDAVIELLCDFYRKTRPAPMEQPAYSERLHERTLLNATHLCAPDLALHRSRIDPPIRAQLAYIAKAGRVLGQRAPRVVDGHGDLRPEHVYLGPEPCVIDCLEFDGDLRRLDPAEEIANLALGCSRLGRPDLAQQLMRQYRTVMSDPAPEHLLAFYMSQRAVTAAKIAAWHVRDPMYSRRGPWIALANTHLDGAARHARLALRELENGKPSLLDCGRPLP